MVLKTEKTTGLPRTGLSLIDSTDFLHACSRQLLIKLLLLSSIAKLWHTTEMIIIVLTSLFQLGRSMGKQRIHSNEQKQKQ